MKANMRGVFRTVISVLTLVAGTAFGIAQTWVANTSSNLSWTTVDSSVDGQRIIAAAFTGPIFTSTNAGSDWITNAAPSSGWSSVASSADGNILVGCRQTSPGNGYLSADGGVTWNYIGRSGSKIDISADGNFLAIASSIISVSTNRGTNWQLTTAPTKTWSCLRVSASGEKIIGAARNDGIFTSTDFGATWTSNSVPIKLWSAAALSYDGSLAIVTAGVKNGGTGPIYVSTNSFADWFEANAPLSNWVAVAMSADGKRAYALAAGSSPTSLNPVYASTNRGVDWFDISGPNAWWSDIAASADGGRLVAVASLTNAIFTSESVVKPILKISADDDPSISWLTPSTDFVLQQTASLTDDNWISVTNVPELNLTNLHQHISLPATNSAMLFRLKGL